MPPFWEIPATTTTPTPGPWPVVEHTGRESGIYGGRDHVASLSIEDICTEETQEELAAEMDANARLIAAAPELLAGLKDALDYIRTYCGRAHGIDLAKWQAVVARA